MPKTPAFPITVFYDGACIVCSTEIEQYRRQDRVGRLTLVDISTTEFKPERYGISLQEFMFELHVIDNEGTVFKGIEGFWAIWQAFPASTLYGLLGTIITMPLVNPLARLAYRGFARIRRYLPKRHKNCENGSCRIGRQDD
jgi:predicted DCC family thiol-disulfide oxidoreductase YuxK